jgi:hypothetical protein
MPLPTVVAVIVTGGTSGDVVSLVIGIILSNAFAEEGWEWVLGAGGGGGGASAFPLLLSESGVGVAAADVFVLSRLVFFGADEDVADVVADDEVLLFRFLLLLLLLLLLPPCFFVGLGWSKNRF